MNIYFEDFESHINNIVGKIINEKTDESNKSYELYVKLEALDILEGKLRSIIK